METRFLYLLRDPRDRVVRYFGVTVNPRVRLQLHIHSKRGNTRKVQWCQELRSLGLQPIMEILHETSRAEAEAMEMTLIEEYFPQLLNDTPSSVFKERWRENKTSERLRNRGRAYSRRLRAVEKEWDILQRAIELRDSPTERPQANDFSNEAFMEFLRRRMEQ